MTRKLITTLSKKELEDLVSTEIHKSVDLGCQFRNADATFDWNMLLNEGKISITLEVEA